MTLELLPSLVPEDAFDFSDLFKTQEIPPVREAALFLRMTPAQLYVVYGGMWMATGALFWKTFLGGWPHSPQSGEEDVDDQQRNKLS